MKNHNKGSSFRMSEQIPKVNKYKTGFVTYQPLDDYHVYVTIWNFGKGAWLQLLK